MEKALGAPEVSLDGTRSWHGTDVKVADVARELRLLRAMAGEDLHSTLTSVMNLVAWAPNAAAAREIEAIADGLRDHHPSRVVIVIPAEGGDSLDARVDVMCHPDKPGGRTLQVEQIVLKLHGAVAAHAGSVVIPLIRSELPTFLWWPTAPDTTAPVFRELGRVADRLVTETGRALRGAAAVRRLAQAIATSPAPLTDLSWAVVTPWRQMLATSLRGDALIRARTGPTHATVSHSRGEPPLEAMLFGGWLVDALGDQTTVDFAEVDGGEDILGVRIEASGTSLAITRDPGGHTVTVTSAAGSRCVPLQSPDRRLLLAGELEHRGPDHPMERAVELADKRATDQPTG